MSSLGIISEKLLNLSKDYGTKIYWSSRADTKKIWFEWDKARMMTYKIRNRFLMYIILADPAGFARLNSPFVNEFTLKSLVY